MILCCCVSLLEPREIVKHSSVQRLRSRTGGGCRVLAASGRPADDGVTRHLRIFLPPCIGDLISALAGKSAGSCGRQEIVEGEEEYLHLGPFLPCPPMTSQGAGAPQMASPAPVNKWPLPSYGQTRASYSAPACAMTGRLEGQTCQTTGYSYPG